MTSSEIVRSALIKSGKTQRDLARYIGVSPQAMNIRLRKETLTFNELERILSFLGHRIMVLGNDGQPLRHYGNSKGPRLTSKIDGKVYDTSKASLLDSMNDRELYVDTTGQEFVAYRLPGGKGIIRADPVAIEGFKRAVNNTPANR